MLVSHRLVGQTSIGQIKVGRKQKFVSGGTPAVNITNLNILDSAINPSLVGVLSVSGGIGVYTYSLTSNPGALFAIAGANLNTNAAMTIGSYPITVRANNGAGSIIDKVLTVVVSSASGSEPIPFFF